MSVTTTVLPDAEAEEKPKKSKKKLLIIVVAVLVLLLGVGGFVAKGMLAPPPEPEPDPKALPGVIETLLPVTLNLADGRYLKLTLALQLSEAASLPAAGGGHEPPAAGEPIVDGAKALDAAIAVLGQRTYAQLLAPSGRASAQKVLSAKVKKLYHGDVLKVYFTEFLMQ
jgi:flagellar FliL protein